MSLFVVFLVWFSLTVKFLITELSLSVFAIGTLIYTFLMQEMKRQCDEKRLIIYVFNTYKRT